MKYVYISLVVLGLLGFISLYILVCIFKESSYPLIQYLIPLIGYVSIILFGFGWFNILRNKENKK